MGKGPRRMSSAAGSSGPAAPVHTSAHVQLLGLGLDDSGVLPSVMLFFDHSRYLFNVGEGFQRFCVEHKLRLPKLSNVLLTRADSLASNGIPGLLLTLADVASSMEGPPHELALYGPPRVQALMASVGTLVSNSRHCRVTTHALGADADWGAPVPELPPVVEEGVVRITPILLRPVGVPAPVRRKPVVTKRADSPGTEQGSPKRARQDAPPAAPQEAAPAEQGESVCYLCELADVPGKFDPAKAAALGVTPGPTFGRLVRGESVTVADGSTVQPSDVVSPASPGPVALIVDVPTLAHLSAAAAHPRFQAPLTHGRTLGVVVHLTPHAVASTPEYTAWAASLLGGAGGACGHIMASPEVAGAPVVMRSSARLAGRLTLMHPDIFPPLLLAGSGTAAEAAAELAAEAPLGAPLPEPTGPPPLRVPPAGAPPGALVGENLLRWKLRPLAGAGADREAVPPALPSYAALRSALAHGVPDALQLAAAMRAAWAAPSPTPLPPALQALVPGSADDAEVVFLGTGAAIPSKYRNVSGILVQMPGRGGCILDCGEGTLGQLRRRYGAAGADAVLASLRLIWISHIHADHHVGIISLLAARRRVLGPDCAPICVVGPWPLRGFLGLHSSGVEPLAHRFLDLAVTTAERQAEGVAVDAAEAAPYAMFQASVRALGMQRLHSVRVIHCAHAYGAVLESTAGLKIVYSGDTRPCPALVEAARGATLLIHEATFEDALIDEARAKKHSATHEALATGAAAGAFRTLLTHFSQRYPKIPVLDDSAAAVADSTAIAFDLMRVRMSDLPALPRIMPPLRALFDDPSLEGADEGEDAPVA